MDTVQSSPQRDFFQDKPTMSRPQQCLRVNSWLSDYLAQHGTLDLSRVTRPTLSPMLAHAHKHT